jgi:hypothetical protein
MHNEDTTHSGGAAAGYGGAFCPGKRWRSSDACVHCPAGGNEPSNKGRVRWFACVPRRAFVQRRCTHTSYPSGRPSLASQPRCPAVPGTSQLCPIAPHLFSDVNVLYSCAMEPLSVRASMDPSTIAPESLNLILVIIMLYKFNKNLH